MSIYGPEKRLPWTLRLDMTRTPIPPCCKKCGRSFPSADCRACVTRIARTMDRAQAIVALAAVTEPTLRAALRFVLGVRWGIQRLGSVTICRRNWHLRTPEGRCYFCRRDRNPNRYEDIG